MEMTITSDQRRSRGVARVAAWVTGIACVGLLLGVGSVVALHSLDKPPQLLTLDQLRQLSLNGTWRDKAGATIVFTAAHGLDSNHFNDTTGGDFSFGNVPNIFDYRTVNDPPPNGHGYWTIDGTTAGTIFFTFQGDVSANGEPKVSLRVEGTASSPVLLCHYPDTDDTCTFRRQ
jgi:hypothetical protein